LEEDTGVASGDPTSKLRVFGRTVTRTILAVGDWPIIKNIKVLIRNIIVVPMHYRIESRERIPGACSAYTI
jgi:hypothetical protein